MSVLAERDYVVEFACAEAHIRRGPSRRAVSGPDDLGCPPTRVRLLKHVRLRSLPWEKNGCLRCEPVDAEEEQS
jgi:hypothetical protein